MAWKHLSVIVFVINLLHLVSPFGIGKREGLYGPEDKGIVNLETGNFSSTVVGSKTAFLVEFYSSYCGHCINFAPAFKEFALNVAGWNSIIRVGAIDCAQDINMPVCRDYEIMGYPSIKFFPVNADKRDLGELRTSHSKEIHDIISDMLEYLEKMESNETLSAHTHNWPRLAPLTSGNLNDIWSSPNENAPFAILIVEDSRSILGRQLLMDVWPKIQDLSVPLVIRRVIADTESGQSLLNQVGLTDTRRSPVVVVVDKKTPGSVEILWQGGQNPRAGMSKSVNDFIWKKTKSLTGIGERASKKKERIVSAKSSTASNVVKLGDDLSQHEVLNESEIKRRRYTAFMSDMENSILYSLSHEISQRAVISDKALTSLQNFVDVLVKYFPGRKNTIKFLQELQTFVRAHEDMIRGEDLQDKVTELRVQTKAFADLGTNWIGCRGSKPMYGGYPCSVWTLWHTLTVSQLTGAKDDDPREVLRAMVSYIDTYFGCRDCARHFMIVAEDGNAIERDIKSPENAVLWLWKAHNKANKRLSGDLTDDRAFPKEIYPNRQHCTQCYDEGTLGSDLWSEFRRENVLEFLKNLYRSESISMQGLSLDNGGLAVGNRARASDSHDLILLEQVDKKNFSENENSKNWGLAFSPVDISLCFGIYVLSAVILIVVYLKFVAKKKFSHYITSLCGRPRSPSHPMSGKV